MTSAGSRGPSSCASPFDDDVIVNVRLIDVLNDRWMVKKTILIDTDTRALTVPEEAIVRFAGVSKLFAVSGDRVTAVPLQIGTRLAARDAAGVAHQWVEVVGDVVPGSLVVTTGHSQLADGSLVRVRETQAAQESPALPLDAATREARRLEPVGSRKDAR